MMFKLSQRSSSESLPIAASSYSMRFVILTISFSIAVFSVFKLPCYYCNLVLSALIKAKCLVTSSFTRCSSFLSALRVSWHFIVKTFSRVSFSDLKIWTSFLCVLSCSWSERHVSIKLLSLPLRWAVLSLPPWFSPVYSATPLGHHVTRNSYLLR